MRSAQTSCLSSVTQVSFKLRHKLKLLLKCKFTSGFMTVFVCCFAFLHPEITKRQEIIRVKIQSKQDVNNQEVKTAILQQVGFILLILYILLLITAARPQVFIKL